MRGELFRARGWRASGLWRIPSLIAAFAVAIAAGAGSANAAEPGFTPILDGSATGGPASFDQWHKMGGGATSGFSLQPNGAVRTDGEDGGGQLIYPKHFGDAIFRLQYRDANPTGEYSNGGIFVRFPVDQLCTPLLPMMPACTLITPVESRPTRWVYEWPGMPGPFPPPQTYANDPENGDASTGFRAYCSRSHAPVQRVAINCGHEIQVNDSPDGGTLDPIKTGSIYNMANLDATSGYGGSGAQARLDADVAAGWVVGEPRAWHDIEIRVIGQQYTVLIDGAVVNKYDNGIPLQPTRAGDPPSQARQFAAGGFAVQDHGNSVVEYRNVRVKEVSRPPVNTRPPSIAGSGKVGRPLTCKPGKWANATKAHATYEWFRSTRAPQEIGALAPTEVGYDHELVGTGKHYRRTPADAAPGKVLWCRAAVTTAEGTAWATAAAPVG